MKRTSFTTALAAILAAHSQGVLAATWTQVARTANSTIFVDKESGERANGHAAFWGKLVFDSPQRMPGNGAWMLETRTQFDIDCTSNTQRTIEHEVYTPAGKLLETLRRDAAEGFRPFASTSAIGAMARVMCAEGQ